MHRDPRKLEQSSLQLEINRRFCATGPVSESEEAILASARTFAQDLVRAIPSGRQLSLALTKIEEAALWARSAARDDKETDELLG